MTLDLFTTSFVTAVVVITSGLVFLLETVVRRDSAAGRYWAAAFLAGILTSLAYLMWALSNDAWVAVAAGNASFVTQVGFMWLGCRVYNGHRGAAPGIAVAAGGLIAFVTAVIDRDAGDWAAAPAMLLGIGAFAALAAVETRRGALRREVAARGLTLVLTLAAAYYLSRTAVFLVEGPSGALFETWFGTNVTSLVSIVVTIVTVVSTSVLRMQSERTGSAPDARGRRRPQRLLPRQTFLPVLRDIVVRSGRAQAPLAVIAVRVTDVPQIAAAFGRETAELIESGWRDAVHRHAPLGGAVGALDDDTAGLALHAASPADARDAADELRQCLIDELSSIEGAVLPRIGIGVALASEHGYDHAALVSAAREAAARSAGAAA